MLGYRQSPIVLQLSMEDPIIAFSEELTQQLMYTETGWFHKQVVPERGCFTCSDLYGPCSKNIVHEDLLSMIPLISKRLNEHGLPVITDPSASDINVEIHYANAGNEPVHSSLDIHQDNDGGMSGYLHTLIAYVHVDCQGGELNIYSDQEELLEQIQIKANMVVMFDGGLYHQPQKITNGTRVAVSYQIRQSLAKTD